MTVWSEPQSSPESEKRESKYEKIDGMLSVIGQPLLHESINFLGVPIVLYS
jgi:hypothetical protein